MKRRPIALTFLIAGIASAAAYGFYTLGMNRGMQMATGSSSASGGSAHGAQKPGDVDPATGKKVLYWHDPMVPGQKFDQPGRSPFMDMQLVPVYEDAGGDAGGVAVNPRMQQSLGVRTAEVTKAAISPPVEAVGSVAYNERDVAVVQARANGFVEKLYVRAPLDPVRRGQALAALYVPDWVAAQEEFLSARRLAGTRMEGLIQGARQRMRLAGMTEESIKRVEATGEVQPRLVMYAPIDGVVSELAAREGMTVMSGAPLYRINGLRTVWVNAEVRESESAQIKVGNAVEARAAALPGKSFHGKVGAILPQVDPATRTLKARVEIANPGTELKPGMFVTVDFAAAARKEVPTVPTEAVIQTGKRTVVIVAQDDGRFAPAEVETGAESDGRTEIRKGLEAGQKIVVSGQFLIDSEASLRAVETRMAEPSVREAGAPPQSGTHKSKGKVESIGQGEIVLSHDAIASLQWPAMTMGFKTPNGVPKDVSVGDTVDFELRQTKDGQFEISSISRARPK